MIDNIDDITVSTPAYFLPVFNVCEFKVEGCPIGASIKTLITCGDTTYTDERATYNGKAQVDIAGYLRAFFTSFREDFVRHQQIYVEMVSMSICLTIHTLRSTPLAHLRSLLALLSCKDGTRTSQR